MVDHIVDVNEMVFGVHESGYVLTNWGFIDTNYARTILLASGKWCML